MKISTLIGRQAKMSYRNAGDLPPDARIGPLTPYQRPLALLLYLGLPFAVSILIGWLILESGWLRSWVREQAVAPTEVKHDTISVAKLANSLLLDLEKQLQKFDARSREIFGNDHCWVIDGERAQTPEDIYAFVKKSRNERFLRNYYELSVKRVKFEQELRDLESTVDKTVSSIPKNATPERVFLAQRLINREIELAIENLGIQSKKLDALEEMYQPEKSR